jgi:hypothetical protein
MYDSIFFFFFFFLKKNKKKKNLLFQMKLYQKWNNIVKSPCQRKYYKTSSEVNCTRFMRKKQYQLLFLGIIKLFFLTWLITKPSIN